MTDYWTKDTQKRLRHVDWDDEKETMRFFSGLSADEIESFVLAVTQHLPTSDRNSKEAFRGAGYICVLAKAQRFLRGTDRNFFADGRLEDWLGGWLPYFASFETHEFERFLSLVLQVENEIGSDRAAPVVADLIRGTVSGRDVEIWPRFQTVLAVCRMPATAPVVEALVGILDDPRFPPKEGTADLVPRLGIGHLAAMALLEIGDPVGLRGLIEAWLSTTSKPANPDRYFPNFPVDVVAEDRTSFGLGYIKQMLPGLRLEKDPPFPILTGNAEVLGEAWKRLSDKTGVDEAAPFEAEFCENPLGFHPAIIGALSWTGRPAIIEPILSNAPTANWHMGFVDSWVRTALRNSSPNQQQQGLESITKALSSESPDVREMATAIVGEYRFTAAESQLRRLLDDSERKVRRAAKRALKTIARGR